MLTTLQVDEVGGIGIWKSSQFKRKKCEAEEVPWFCARVSRLLREMSPLASIIPSAPWQWIKICSNRDRNPNIFHEGKRLGAPPHAVGLLGARSRLDPRVDPKEQNLSN
jgi:hypothetical protein